MPFKVSACDVLVSLGASFRGMSARSGVIKRYKTAGICVVLFLHSYFRHSITTVLRLELAPGIPLISASSGSLR